MTIKIYIVDDSATVRTVLKMILEKEPEIEVLGTAANASIALRKMDKAWPDVIITDLEMPGMHGLDFIRHVTRTRPTPMVVCSSHVGSGAKAAMDALALGAVEIIAKPNIGVQSYLEDITQTIVESVKAASQVVMRAPLLKKETRLRTSVPPKRIARHAFGLIAIGSSTGGTTVVEHILKQMKQDAPGIVVIQHMPEYFTTLFAKRLNDICGIEVKEAADGDEIRPGRALIAPGGHHLVLSGYEGNYRVRVTDELPVNGHRPSVDVFFRSVAELVADNALGIILTGMGEDGAEGLLKMKQAGAITLGQDESTSAVYGMPKAAMNRGAVQYQFPYQEIPVFINDLIYSGVAGG